MEIRRLEAGHEAALARFLARIPDGDRTFFKDDVDDPDVISAWVRGRRAACALALDGDDVVGYVGVFPLTGWSSHVGEVRVVVDPVHRGRGIGRALTRQAVREALALGLTKLVVEVVADQEAAIGMFRALGFDPEALLADHVRDQHGDVRDLMILAHSVDSAFAALDSVGLTDALDAS
jgi:ribosomal protein S18 acetylase RimI-like enzyme